MKTPQRKKHILFLDPADFLGGAESFSLDIFRHISDEGAFAITVVTTGGCKEYMNGIPKNVRVICMRIPRLRPFRPFSLLKTVLSLRKCVQKQKVDIVHSNSVRAGILAYFLKKPWTHSAHDFTLPKYLAFLFRKAQCIFACSIAVKNDLIKKGIHQKNIQVNYNGVDISHFFHLKKKYSAKNCIIALVGRIDVWKGQDIFVQAAKHLQKDLPFSEFRIYGQSSAHNPKTQIFERELKQYVAGGHITNVRFFGHKPIESILSQVDILVHASTKPEPFGRTIIEAMAAKIPVLATNIGGPKEILTGSVLERLLIPHGDAHLLAKKIQWLHCDEKFQKQYIHAAQERIKDFSLQSVTQKIFLTWGDIQFSE
jgi:glycosyltransferase involved in cell wall biosynthesis